MALSTYIANKILNAICRNTAMPSLGTIYLSAHTGNPGTAGSNEVAAGNNYSRVALASAFTAASGGSNASNVLITFPTTTGPWGDVSYVGLWDASSGGNFLMSAALDGTYTISNGDILSIASGNLTFSG